MKIVQTLWSNNKNLLKNSFGWLSPMYHLMGWTLSCLRLQEYYDDIHLYTDSRASELLIDYLRLPYKKVHLHYDNMGDYNENMWAVSKISTYATQEKPFIHVDGDVFIWERFSPDLENAPLIAQNLEIGTSCYKDKMNYIRTDLTYIPEFLQAEIDKESIPSYNAGILGGSDIAFFQQYAKMAMELADNNYQGEMRHKANLDFNILFEQILFYSLTARENKPVTCYFKEPIIDNGYNKDFCDFSAVPYKQKYLHLLGGHKRNKEACTLMGQLLFQHYPEYYGRINVLFQQQGGFFSHC